MLALQEAACLCLAEFFYSGSRLRWLTPMCPQMRTRSNLVVQPMYLPNKHLGQV